MRLHQHHALNAQLCRRDKWQYWNMYLLDTLTNQATYEIDKAQAPQRCFSAFILCGDHLQGYFHLT